MITTPPQIDTANRTIRLLVVSPVENDHAALHRILPPQKWTLSSATTLQSAQRHLRTANARFPLVLCERNLSPGTWRDLFDQLTELAGPPLLIVSSLFADEHLWAEALNIGAHDVLAKPFEPEEVRRVLTSAWVRWAREHPFFPQSEHRLQAAVVA